MVKPSLVRAMAGCAECVAAHADTMRLLKQMAERYPQLADDVQELETMMDHLDTTAKLFASAVGAGNGA